MEPADEQGVGPAGRNHGERACEAGLFVDDGRQLELVGRVMGESVSPLRNATVRLAISVGLYANSLRTNTSCRGRVRVGCGWGAVGAGQSS